MDCDSLWRFRWMKARVIVYSGIERDGIGSREGIRPFEKERLPGGRK